MAKLLFDQTGERFFETGVKKCALFVYNTANKAYDKGVAWNGITNFTLSPSGAEATPLYADDIKYLNLISAEEMGGTVEAYMYPDEFAECIGEKSPITGMKVGQQTRKTFGVCFQSTIGNDVDPELGFKLHIVYGCLAGPSEKAYNTINDSPEAGTFSYELSTTPVDVGTIEGVAYKPTAYVELNSIDFVKEGVLDANFQLLLDKLYGTESEEPTLLMPGEIFNLLKTGNVEGTTGA